MSICNFGSKSVVLSSVLLPIILSGMLAGCACGRIYWAKDTGIVERTRTASYSCITYSQFLAENPEPPNGYEIKVLQKWLTRTTQDFGYTDYHSLLLFMQHGNTSIISKKIQAQIICEALRMLPCLNDFGVVGAYGSYDAYAAELLLATGKEGLPFLLPVLDDKRQAPISGSASSTSVITSQTRRCDYAHRYAEMILHGEFSLQRNIAERDKKIAEVKKDIIARQLTKNHEEQGIPNGHSMEE